MAQLDPGARPKATVLDPVCGMKVDPATAKFQTRTEEGIITSVVPAAATKFQALPKKILRRPQSGWALGW